MKKIVFVDQDCRYRKKVKLTLFNEGYFPIVCRQGHIALKIILSEKTDLVIVANNLPDMSGEDFYTAYQTSSNKVKDLPFIITLDSNRSQKTNYYNLGFCGCLVKPYSSKELIKGIEDIFLHYHINIEEKSFWKMIRESRDFLEGVVESSIDSIITTDTRGMITYCNRATEDMFGYRFEDLIGVRVADVLHNGASEMLRIAAMLKKYGRIDNYKTIIKSNKNREIPIDLSISIMKNKRGINIGALGISKRLYVNNLSLYKSMESNRIATILETAVAVNHEINNPLVPILGNAQFLLQDESELDDDTKSRIKIIIKNALRIKYFTQKLAKITQPVTTEYMGETKMLDIKASL